MATTGRRRRRPARPADPGPPPRRFEAEVGAVAAGGGCVAHDPDGRVAFVRHALPGERVVAEVTSETRSFVRADAVEILVPSPDRVEPPCPSAGPGRCGGCDWQHVRPARQRALKADLVAEQLRRVAGWVTDVEVEEVPGAADGLGWRTRVEFAVDRDGRPGLLGHRSHRVVPVDRCAIASPGVTAVGVTAVRWPGVRRLEVVAPTDGGPAVVAVSSSRGGPGTLPEVDGGLVVDGEVVAGPDAVDRTAGGFGFRVRADVFWQVHPGAGDVLVSAVLDGLAPVAGERAVDLFAGAGLFTVPLASAVGPTGAVTAVEWSARACEDLRGNVDRLPTGTAAPVTVVPEPVTAALVADRLTGADLVVLDPSRAGAGPEVLAAVAAGDRPPRRVAYVACAPATLARDLRVLLDRGWTVRSLRAFDLFPMTEHVEVVVVLDRPAPG